MTMELSRNMMPVTSRLLLCLLWTMGSDRGLAFAPPFRGRPVVATIATRKTVLFRSPRQRAVEDAPSQSMKLQLRFFQDIEETEGETSSPNSAVPSKDGSTSSRDISSLMSGIPSNLSSMLTPIAVVLDDATDGWALTYADLTPETDKTPLGLAFLATNVAYTIVGVLLQLHGDVLLGTLTELASVASFAYHFGQLNLGPDQAPVRVALMLDYIVAACTLLTALTYVLTTNPSLFPMEALVAMVLSVVCLCLSWVWERGWPYIVNHGLWHLLGAYAGYMIGTIHMMTP